ncbi:YtfJ family protein [Vibrio maerlii]|uniref:YtfJ family protein n=1 Tax=Vibrio maerlii TaxID=2231648 RepID=UPI000E3DBD75|nr:YtfJ family protein [Vibrio maerlii]
MRIQKSLLTLALTLASAPLLAHNLTVGNTVPKVDVPSHGEIVIDQGDTAYVFWSSEKMLGKVRVIQAIAGRSSSKEMNAPLMSAITAAKFPEEQYQTTTVINQDDALWGTGGFVKSSAESSKEEFPWSSMVLDEEGAVANTWGLQEESSAIIVLDKQGKVLFVKEGSLNDSEIKQVIEMISASL